MERGLNARTLQLGEAVRRANRAILERSQADEAYAGMGTTVVGAWVDGGVVSVAHVGDSRAYLANASGFETLTSDHSLVEAQVQAGMINREQSLKSEHQNILLRALGRDPTVEVDLAEVIVAIGDRLLLCTDGLTRMVSDDELSVRARALSRRSAERLRSPGRGRQQRRRSRQHHRCRGRVPPGPSVTR